MCLSMRHLSHNSMFYLFSRLFFLYLFLFFLFCSRKVSFLPLSFFSGTIIQLEIHTFMIMLLLSMSHRPICSCSLFCVVMRFIEAAALAPCISWQNVINNIFYFGISHDMLMFWSHAAVLISQENNKIYSSSL